MKNFFDNIVKSSEKLSELFEKYLDWLMNFPAALGLLLLFLSIAIPIFLISSSSIYIINKSYKEECLNNINPRRWHNALCEEYVNSQWIKIDPYKKNIIYQYNQTAAEIIR